MYLEDKYLEHLSKKGNMFVAKQFYKYIKNKELL